jgi:transcriptional regulator with XRE-family HTH domain
MDLELGQRIKRLRKEKRLNLRDLAEMSSLSIGYLSLVERGLTSISLNSLKKVATALGVGSSVFLEPTPQVQEKVVRGYNLGSFKLHESRVVYQSLTGDVPRDEQNMEPLLVTLLPGQQEENVLPYSHEGEEFGYVLEGVLTFIVENHRYDLNPGDSLHVPSQIPHNWANLTNSLVRLLYVNTTKVF